jgi:hypothetical protein
VIGQARSDGAITPEHESAVLERALRFWALQTSMDTVAARGAPRRPRWRALPPTTRYPAHAAY